MMYYELKINDKEYKLRLDVRSVVSLEKELGKNPLFVFTKKVPETEEMVLILYHSLKHYYPEATIEEAYAILDAWIDSGKLLTEFVSVCVEIYTISGLFKPEGKEEKN